MATTKASVTEQLAEWIVKADYTDVPTVGVERVRDRVLDSLGVMFAGMSVSTGQIMRDWIKVQGGTPDSTVVASGFKTTATLATLVNTSAGHALEFDDIATFGGHFANPLTAAMLAIAEKLGSSGRDAVLAWLVGWDVIAQTSKPCFSAQGNSLLSRGWFNQGFQPALGVAALAAKLMGLDVLQTRMALGNAAAAMGGLLKNRGSDTKSFQAGNAAMHGVMAAELVALGFTANEDILDGDIGVARLLGLEDGDPEKVLDGLGSWDMATNGSTIRLHACCGASHWGQDALLKILQRRPTAPDEIAAIEIEIDAFLMPMVPYHDPQTGLEAKYSLEYDLATIALDGRAGLHQYADVAVQRPEARALMQRVTTHPVEEVRRPESRVVLTLKSGEQLEESVNVSHGSPSDPLTDAEILGKFHECSDALLPEAQRQRVVELCRRLDSLASIRELTDAIGTGQA
jgi:2-methylcitrate dehydratase PrpD